MDLVREARISTILFFFLISLGLIGLFLVVYQSGVLQSFQDSTRGLIHRTLVLNMTLNLVTVVGILLWYEKLRWQDVGIIFGKLPLAMVLGASTWITIQGIELIAGILIKGHSGLLPDWQQSSLSILGLLIGHLFGTAFWEEIAFRGFLLKQSLLRLSQKIEGKKFLLISSILVSQSMFVLFHVPWKLINFDSYPVLFGELAGIVLTGIIYAIFYLRTGNLFLVMIYHALGNAPTSLVNPVLGTSNLLLLFMVFVMVFWPVTREEKRNTR